MSNVWDVVPPKDNWERNYARLAYLATGIKQTFSLHIPVENEEDNTEFIFHRGVHMHKGKFCVKCVVMSVF